MALGDALRTRRFAALAGAPLSFRYFRVSVNVTSATAVVFNLSNVYVYAESATLSATRVRSFTHSRTSAYDLVFTDQNAEVYSAAGTGPAARLASVPLRLNPTKLTSGMIPTMKSAQQLDTMLLFHQNLQPMRILRMGSDTEWNADLAPLTDIPNYDYGAGYANGVAAQWQLSFFNFDASFGSIALPNGGGQIQLVGTSIDANDSWQLSYRAPGATWVEQALQRMSLVDPRVLMPAGSDVLAWYNSDLLQLDKLAAVVVALATQ